MGLLLLLLLLLLLHVQAEDFNISVALMEPVLLHCSLNISDVYWYMEVHSGFRSRIIRTFSELSDQHFIITPGKKFTTVRSNVLKILNVTADDYRLYLCARKEGEKIIFQDSFTLVPGAAETTAPPPALTCSSGGLTLLLYSSLSLNGLLLLTGLALLCLRKRRMKDEPSADSQENMEAAGMPQYEEIRLPPRAPPAALPQDDIYSKAGFPQRHLGRC